MSACSCRAMPPADNVPSIRQALVSLSPESRRELLAALEGERRPRQRRRYRAILLLGDGSTAREASVAVKCSLASVYSWASAWRTDGVRGLREKPRRGGKRRLDGRAEELLLRLLLSDSRTPGGQDWTVPLLLRSLAEEGYAVSERTVRRTLHRLGWLWERPRYVQKGREAG